MELGALVYGNSDGPTKKAGMAALRFLSGKKNDIVYKKLSFLKTSFLFFSYLSILLSFVN